MAPSTARNAGTRPCLGYSMATSVSSSTGWPCGFGGLRGRQGRGVFTLAPEELLFRDGGELGVRGRGEGCGDVHFLGGVRAALAQVRNGGQQGLGVLVLRVVEDLRGRAGFHDHAAAHHGDAVREVGHDAHVVGDQHDGAVQLVAQVAHEVQDFGLDRHVEGRGGLVGDEQFGIAGQRLRDHGALPLAAGELVG